MRLSSNLIKSNYIYFNDNNRRIIDSNNKIPIVVEPVIEEVNDDVEFREGLNPTPIELINDEDYVEQSQEVIEEANQKANQIINDARIQAENEKNSIYNSAKEEGYKAGYEESLEKIATLEKELENKKNQLIKEYEEKIKEIEPSYGELLIAYLKKLTGIAAEEHSDIILYLICQSISGSEQSNSYRIRVSKEDYPLVEAKREEIETLFKKEVEYEILEDISLSKNDCIIETDNRVVDCSLQIQLDNLITDLKILSRT